MSRLYVGVLLAEAVKNTFPATDPETDRQTGETTKVSLSRLACPFQKYFTNDTIIKYSPEIATGQHSSTKLWHTTTPPHPSFVFEGVE